jgi:hypothetical protein
LPESQCASGEKRANEIHADPIRLSISHSPFLIMQGRSSEPTASGIFLFTFVQGRPQQDVGKRACPLSQRPRQATENTACAALPLPAGNLSIYTLHLRFFCRFS